MLKAPNKEKNFFTLIKMISAMGTREDDEDYKNHVDQMFDELEKEDPNHFAVRQYRKFKLAAGVTLYIRHLTYVIIMLIGFAKTESFPPGIENTVNCDFPAESFP